MYMSMSQALELSDVDTGWHTVKMRPVLDTWSHSPFCWLVGTFATPSRILQLTESSVVKAIMKLAHKELSLWPIGSE